MPAISTVLLLAAAIVWVGLRRSRAATAWRTGRRRVAALLVNLVAGLAGAGLVVSFGPMRPLFGTSRTLAHYVGARPPDLLFQVAGHETSRPLSSLQGRVVLVNLWATWCPPCRRELPVLDRLQLAYRDRGLVVLTLTDQAPADVRATLARDAPHALNGTVASFDWLAIGKFRPFTLILDRQGMLRDYLFGDQPYDVFEARIRPYL